MHLHGDHMSDLTSLCCFGPVLDKGGKGVDVFIHEMLPPGELWILKNFGPRFPDHSYPGSQEALDQERAIEELAHTSQGALGYLLSQMDPRPQLTVAVHFSVADDTVACALDSVAVQPAHEPVPLRWVRRSDYTDVASFCHHFSPSACHHLGLTALAPTPSPISPSTVSPGTPWSMGILPLAILPRTACWLSPRVS